MSFNINNLPQCLDSTVVLLFIANGNDLKAFDQVLNHGAHDRAGTESAQLFFLGGGCFIPPVLHLPRRQKFIQHVFKSFSPSDF